MVCSSSARRAAASRSPVTAVSSSTCLASRALRASASSARWPAGRAALGLLDGGDRCGPIGVGALPVADRLVAFAFGGLGTLDRLHHVLLDAAVLLFAAIPSQHGWHVPEDSGFGRTLWGYPIPICPWTIADRGYWAYLGCLSSPGWCSCGTRLLTSTAGTTRRRHRRQRGRASSRRPPG